MEEFNRIAHDFKIPVIEDAAHALGAKFNGQLIGSNSPYTLFSLQAIKHVTTVDGGFLCVGNQKDYEKARLKRWFGLDKTKSRLENDIQEVGFKYGMNNVTATIGLVQMRYLEDLLIPL